MRAVACFALALYTLNSAILIWLHLRIREVHPLAHAVSDYGLGSSKIVFKIHGVVGSAAALALAYLVTMSVHPVFPAHIAAYLLLMAIARLVVGLVPTDGGGDNASTAGRIHMIAAAVVFLCAGLIVVDGSRLMAVAWPAYAKAWMLLKWLVMVMLAGMVVSRIDRWRRTFGFFERAFIATTTIWFMALAAFLALAS